jgi:hypothetical protein
MVVRTSISVSAPNPCFFQRLRDPGHRVRERAVVWTVIAYSA